MNVFHLCLSCWPACWCYCLHDQLANTFYFCVQTSECVWPSGQYIPSLGCHYVYFLLTRFFCLWVVIVYMTCWPVSSICLLIPLICWPVSSTCVLMHCRTCWPRPSIFVLNQCMCDLLTNNFDLCVDTNVCMTCLLRSSICVLIPLCVDLLTKIFHLCVDTSVCIPADQDLPSALIPMCMCPADQDSHLCVYQCVCNLLAKISICVLISTNVCMTRWPRTSMCVLIPMCVWKVLGGRGSGYPNWKKSGKECFR